MFLESPDLSFDLKISDFKFIRRNPKSEICLKVKLNYSQFKRNLRSEISDLKSDLFSLAGALLKLGYCRARLPPQQSPSSVSN